MYFRHVGLVPINIKKSLDFYKKFGLNIIKEQIEPEEYVNRLLGIKSKFVKTYKLGYGAKIMIELLEYDLEIIPRGNSVLSQGITHFALGIEDIESLYEKHKDSVEFVSEPLLSPDGYAKVAYCKDPDGNFIELVELLG